MLNDGDSTLLYGSPCEIGTVVEFGGDQGVHVYIDADGDFGVSTTTLVQGRRNFLYLFLIFFRHFNLI
jgi:hypothetical protein